MKKIVRLDLCIKPLTGKYVYDRAYEEDKGNQENCDAAFKALTEAMLDKQAIALAEEVTSEDGKVAYKPCLVNLAVIECITINIARIYDAKEPETNNVQNS